MDGAVGRESESRTVKHHSYSHCQVRPVAGCWLVGQLENIWDNCDGSRLVVDPAGLYQLRRDLTS